MKIATHLKVDLSFKEKLTVQNSGKGGNYTLFEKSNLGPKIQFWQPPNIFTSFSPKFFLPIFFVKSKLSTAKKSKTTTFSRVFPPKKIDNFLGKSKLNFGWKMKISNSVELWSRQFLFQTLNWSKCGDFSLNSNV